MRDYIMNNIICKTDLDAANLITSWGKYGITDWIVFPSIPIGSKITAQNRYHGFCVSRHSKPSIGIEVNFITNTLNKPDLTLALVIQATLNNRGKDTKYTEILEINELNS